MGSSDGKLSPELLGLAAELLGRSDGVGTMAVRRGDASMWPTLRPAQLLVVEFGPQSLRRGDLLVFRQADYLTVHRLLGPARRPDGRPSLRTRGDGRLALDPHLDPSLVVARVIAVQYQGDWRTLQPAPARIYASCLAWHDLFWAAVGSVARSIDGGFYRAGLGRPLTAVVGGIDRGLLAVAHRLLFRLCHARTAPPDPPPAVAPQGQA